MNANEKAELQFFEARETTRSFQRHVRSKQINSHHHVFLKVLGESARSERMRTDFGPDCLTQFGWTIGVCNLDM